MALGRANRHRGNGRDQNARKRPGRSVPCVPGPRPRRATRGRAPVRTLAGRADRNGPAWRRRHHAQGAGSRRITWSSPRAMRRRFSSRSPASFRLLNTYVAATRRVTAAERRALGLGDVMLWDTSRPYHYARWTADHRLLFGGGDRPRVTGRQRVRAFRDGVAALREHFERLLPATRGDRRSNSPGKGCLRRRRTGSPTSARIETTRGISSRSGTAATA